jgi:hypothetical protein
LNPRSRKSVETLVVRAYFELVLVAWGNDGGRAIVLAVHGNYEIRLLEKLSFNAAQTPSLWVDLFDTDTKVLIETCRCDDLEAATVAAEALIARAQSLKDER